MEARIDEYSDWLAETNPDVLKAIFEKMLVDSGFGILNFAEHHFEPQGYTGLWMVSESHFAVHTFPEENKTYIHLSSCNRTMYFKFLDKLKEYKGGST